MNQPPTLSELKSIFLFQDLKIPQLKSLQQYCQVKVFNKGEVIFLEGEPCETIIIVKEGRIKLARSSTSGREQVLDVLEPQHTCACHSSDHPWTCSSNAQAITDGILWKLSRRKYMDLVGSNIPVTRRLNDLLAQRLCRFSALIADVSLDGPERRLAKFILNTTDKQSPLEDNAAAQLQLTHEEMSQRLGLVRETVTRHLQKLKRMKLIQIDRQKISILDRDALEKIAQ